ncbi:hypothetical protein C8Q75DRAFT_811401 [Abortiporus biennis]|nr:hypothetical protein C8Q75DRAFT_811401 [Abortiporus biennis]
MDSCETEDATCLVVFTVDLPILDSITLKTEAYAEVNGEIGFPRDSCMSAFQSLKPLTMSGFTLSAAQRFIRPNITRLNLASARSIDSEGDWTSLIRLLSCLPRLQELVLFRMLFGWERDIATSPSQIHLDSLQKLVVTDHLDRVTRFFTAFSRFSPTLKDVDVHLLLPLRKTTSMDILSQELSRQWNRCSDACTTLGCKEFQFNALLIAFSPRRKGLETKINVCLPGNYCRCAMDKIGNSPSTTRNRKLTLSFSSTGRPSNLTFFKHLFSSLPLGSLLETHVLLHDSQDPAWTPDFDIIDGILFNAGVPGIIDIKGWNEGTLVKWLRRLMELPWESQPLEFKFSPSSWNHIHIARCTFDISGSEPTTTEQFIQLSQEQPESFPAVWCEWNKKWGGRLALRMGALILHYDDIQTEPAAGNMSYEE